MYPSDDTDRSVESAVARFAARAGVDGVRRLAWAVLLGITALTGSVANAGTDPAIDARLSTYAYADTRRLVHRVEFAARLLETEGDAAFERFKVRGSEWFEGPSSYLFAYALDGTCVFDALSPYLVGQNLIDVTDLNGKPVIRWGTDIARMPAPDAYGWLFYLWQDGPDLTPTWKTTYVRKVTTPDGKVYALGSGFYAVKMEHAFVRTYVDRAVEVLRAHGHESASAKLKDPTSEFVFPGASVFVLDEKGRTVVDPVFPSLAGRAMLDFRDAVGDQPILKLRNKLATADEAWVQYMWPRPGEVQPTRRVIYARKVDANGRKLIVGAEFFQATPIWMRG